jgi:hypothetical protein
MCKAGNFGAVAMSLLPYNSTKFERDVEAAIKYAADVSLLFGFRFKNGDPQLQLALAWEYSLAQINIDDFAGRVLKGLEFHRLRGTPAALRNALSWYGFNDIIIEEEVPGEHFAEFQLGITEIPNGFVPDPVINIANFAAPLRSKLSRIYNDLYDERRFILDDSLLGEGLLSDDSGIRLTEDGPKLSFGRVNSTSIEISNPEIRRGDSREHFIFVKNVDTIKWDFANWDDGPLDAVNLESTAEREHSISNVDHIGELSGQLFDSITIPKASIILSEDAILGDLNTNFCGGYDVLDDEPFVLSFSRLSENKTTVRREFIDERFLREGSARAVNDFEYAETGAIQEREHFGALIYENFCGIGCTESEHFSSAEYRGADTWRDHRHFDISMSPGKNAGNIRRFRRRGND